MATMNGELPLPPSSLKMNGQEKMPEAFFRISKSDLRFCISSGILAMFFNSNHAVQSCAVCSVQCASLVHGLYYQQQPSILQVHMCNDV
jgi:hypothetical protein